MEFERQIKVNGKTVTVTVNTEMQTVTPKEDKTLTPQQREAIAARWDDALKDLDKQPF